MKSVVTWILRLCSLVVILAPRHAVPTVIAGAKITNDDRDPGIYDDQVLFGQSAVFSGASKGLGREMRLGIQAAFHEANQTGGIHGRELRLQTLDDAYEPDFAIHTTQRLIEKSQVFALIGTVGTPTSRVAAPIAHDAGVPFLAPFTGAEFLRDPALHNSPVIDIDGFELEYGHNDNQGSDAVSLTVIGADGNFRQVDKLGGAY